MALQARAELISYLRHHLAEKGAIFLNNSVKSLFADLVPAFQVRVRKKGGTRFCFKEKG